MIFKKRDREVGRVRGAFSGQDRLPVDGKRVRERDGAGREWGRRKGGKVPEEEKENVLP